jgi:hypothetical protein
MAVDIAGAKKLTEIYGDKEPIIKFQCQRTFLR